MLFFLAAFPEEVARASEKVHPLYFSCVMMGGSGTKTTCLIAAAYQTRKGSTSENLQRWLLMPSSFLHSFQSTAPQPCQSSSLPEY